MTKTTVLANKLFTWKSLAGFQSKQKHLPLNGIPNITHFLALPPDHYVLSESDKNNSVTKNPQSNLKIINRQLTPLKFTCSFTWKIILLLFLSQEMLYCCWALLSSYQCISVLLYWLQNKKRSEVFYSKVDPIHNIKKIHLSWRLCMLHGRLFTEKPDLA